MVQSFFLREQAERCRRLARDSTGPSVRDGLLSLAEDHTAKADAQEQMTKRRFGRRTRTTKARPD
jgi:hypothetical protein